MQLDMQQLITLLGKSVSEAQRAIQANAIGNYFAYFHAFDSNTNDLPSEDAVPAYTPRTAVVEFPASSGEQAQVRVPVVTMAHHNAVALDSVSIRLQAPVASVEGDQILLDLSGPQDNGPDSHGQTELELCFKCGEPPEGIARINTELNKFI